MNPFAYRVLDLRNRFDEPFATILDALAALYSDRAHMPEESAEIVAYYSDGKQLTVPSDFFLIKKPRFANQVEASDWLTKRNKDIDESDKDLAWGIVLANPKDPFEKQLKDAMSCRCVALNRDKPIKQIALEISSWLQGNVDRAKPI